MQNVPGDGIETDRITGKHIKKNPEERIRQEYEYILHEDYEYAYNLMDIEVSIICGSKTPNECADIVVYDSTTKRAQHKNIVGIVETRRPKRQDGIMHLTRYMTATSCVWGVWTNGDDIAYLYKTLEGKVKENVIYQIPKFGEKVEDLGKIQKDKLQPTNNLKIIFRRMLKVLYSNANISRREKLGNEMTRIIFCKIWDEKYYPEKLPKFRIGFKENMSDVSERINELFDEVKKELAEDGVFDSNEKITLDPKSIGYVVGELERYSLLKTNKDVVGDAFEVFAENKLVGEKGEFFTPREVVKTAVKIVNPQPEQTIFDPACGSGGFLIYALDHVWDLMDSDKKYVKSDIIVKKKEIAQKYFFGIDKEMDLVKIAKAYMAIVGDGRGKLIQQDALHAPDEFTGKAKTIFYDKNETNKLKQFDIIFTNPPFGSKIKVLKNESEQFELGHTITNNGKLGNAKDTEPQELFIERCLQMLKSKGTLAIVLPETYFHAPSKKRVLEFLRKNNNVKAVIDLPHTTFKPHNNAKTILIVIQKDMDQQKKITMAVAEGIGHDALGRILYRYDFDNDVPSREIHDDTLIIRKEIADADNEDNIYTFELPAEEIKDDILVPRYYWKKGLVEIEQEATENDIELIPMRDLINNNIIESYEGHGSPKGLYKGMGDIQYVRVSDIVNWKTYENYTSMIPENEYKRVKGENGIDLKENDVLFVRRGSYRIGTVALNLKDDPKILLTKEITIFRIVDGNNKRLLDAEYLIFLLSHKIVQKQLNNLIFMDTTLPTINKRWMDLRLPFYSKKQTVEIKSKMSKIFENQRSDMEILDELGSKYGKLIT